MHAVVHVMPFVERIGHMVVVLPIQFLLLTSLNGTDRLRVLRTLPAKFDTILPSDLAVPMARLWNVSVLHECVLHILRSMQ